MSSEILIDTHNLEALMKGLQQLPQELQARVIVRSLKYATDRMFTQAKREVSKRYNTRQKDFAAYIQKLSAGEGAGITAIAPHMSMGKFDLRGGERWGQPGTFEVVRGKRSSIPAGSFTATMKSGHRGAFVRDSRSRLPISEKMTIGAAEMLEQTDVRESVELMAADAFNYEFDRQYDLACTKLLQHK